MKSFVRKALIVLSASIFSSTLFASSSPRVIIIAPPALVDLWETEYVAQAGEITGGKYEVVSTDEIYRDYPYGGANKARNPAESIHAYITAQSGEVKNFILGGPWIDAQHLEKDIRLQTGEKLGLDNAVPGVMVDPHSTYGASPSDLYFACADVANEYAWDAEGTGTYLSHASKGSYQLVPDVAVSRIPLVTWREWTKADGGVYSQADLLKAYVAKLRRAMSADFAGLDKYGFYGYSVHDGKATKLSVGGTVERRECEFYDFTRNMFDPQRGTDDFFLSEPISRRHIREQIAASRPITDVITLFERAWSSKYSTREEARAGFREEDTSLKFYYAHGNYTGGHGFSREDFKTAGCGLTILDDCCGPCDLGKLVTTPLAGGGEELQINYALASTLSPFGGSVASVANTNEGMFDSAFASRFDSWFSFRLENNVLVAFVCNNATAGESWRYMAEEYVDSGLTAGQNAVWVLTEVMLLGDPLVKLPAIEENLPYAEGVTVKGRAGEMGSVVSMSIDAGASLMQPETPLRVMNGLTSAGTSLVLSLGPGGIGGEGVRFTGAKGTLTLDCNGPFYLAGLHNASNLALSGEGAVVDLDHCELSGMGSVTLARSSSATLRSATRGAVSAKTNGSLSIPASGSLTLATYDAFGETKGTIYANTDSELVIAANPLSGDGKNHGESLYATISLLRTTYALKIRVAEGGLLTPAEALVGDNRVTYEIDAADGLGGSVRVPQKATLKLKAVPLTKIENLTIESGGTLELPAGTTIEEVISSGLATIKAGAKIVCAGETVVQSADRTLVGDHYRDRFAAFGRADWVYYATGAGDDLAQTANWSRLADYRFETMNKTPLISGSELWDPALLNGAFLATEAGADGKKYLTVSRNIEGWQLRLGVTNNVELTIPSLVKLQGDPKFIYVDETSKVIVESMTNAGAMGGSTDFHVAAEEGLVFKSGIKYGNTSTYNYHLEKNGSVSFPNGLAYHNHIIKYAEIVLAEGDYKTLATRRLIAFGGTSRVAFTLDAAARVVFPDEDVVASFVSRELSTSDAVGTCRFVQRDDGVYIDYVDRTNVAPVDFANPESIGDETTAADVGLSNSAFSSDAGEDLRRIARWAKANDLSLEEVNALESVLAEEAYLLNVRPTAEAVRTARAAFRFVAFKPGEKPVVAPALYNGIVSILGSETLKGRYTDDLSGKKFFKAILARRLVRED